MRNSLDYAGLAQLCARSPIMRKIMRAHNRIIQPSLVLYTQNGDHIVTTDSVTSLHLIQMLKDKVTDTSLLNLFIVFFLLAVWEQQSWSNCLVFALK